jgi:hypothetical protein
LRQLNIGIGYQGVGKVPFKYQIMCGVGHLQKKVALFMKQITIKLEVKKKSSYSFQFAWNKLACHADNFQISLHRTIPKST